MCTVTIIPLLERSTSVAPGLADAGPDGYAPGVRSAPGRCPARPLAGSDGPGFRLVCNRDESLARPAALAPRLVRSGARAAIVPLDPLSGGTWIGVNDAGLAISLLNVHAAPVGPTPAPDAAERGARATPAHGPRRTGGACGFVDGARVRRGAATATRGHQARWQAAGGWSPLEWSHDTHPVAPPEKKSGCRPSRGLIIPPLLSCASVAEALRAVSALAPEGTAPFHLILIDEDAFGEVHWNGLGMQARVWPRGAECVMLTSSGLGDALVQEPRRRLFEEMVLRPPRTDPASSAPEAPRLARAVGGSELAALQDTFHRHSWPDRAHLSVCMRRADARTVSHTVVEVGARAARLTYFPDAPDRASDPVTVLLPLHPAAASDRPVAASDQSAAASDDPPAALNHRAAASGCAPADSGSRTGDALR